MNDSQELAPAVASILRAADARGDPAGGPLSVDARSLPEALSRAEADGRVPIIAEVKPTSPTTEGTREADPVELAEQMVEGGAAALSVLTEPDHFDGSPENLRRVREAVDVPVLRKDFLLREAQLDTVAADAVLLIARFVDDLADLVAAAKDRGFQPLVEVHDHDEFAAAVEAGAEIIGVNNRDLAQLEVDLGTFEDVAPYARRLARREESSGDTARRAPEDVTLIAESGISTPKDAHRMREAGADGLLVGSAIMEGDVTENTRRLTQA
jgi:indole-3-glycerol phosphate synthase